MLLSGLFISTWLETSVQTPPTRLLGGLSLQAGSTHIRISCVTKFGCRGQCSLVSLTPSNAQTTTALPCFGRYWDFGAETSMPYSECQSAAKLYKGHAKKYMCTVCTVTHPVRHGTIVKVVVWQTNSSTAVHVVLTPASVGHFNRHRPGIKSS